MVWRRSRSVDRAMVKSSDKVPSILGEFMSLGQRIAIALTTVNPNEKRRGDAAFFSIQS